MRTFKRRAIVLCIVVMALLGGCYIPLGPDSRLFLQNGIPVIGWDPFTDIQSILP